MRFTRVIGLSVVALALLAMLTAASASATAPKVTTSAYPASLEGKQNGKHRFALEGNRFIECAGATLTGTYTETESKAEEASFTLSPSYSECSAEILGVPTTATVTVNGCTYQLKDEKAASGTPKEEGWEYSGSLTVKCPEGKKIEAHVFETTKKDEEGISLCTYTIAAQGPRSSVDYKSDEAGKKLTVNATLTGVTVTRASGTPTNCGAEAQTATYNGNTGVEAFQSKEGALTGSLDASPTRMTMSSYPATLSGKGVGKQRFALPGSRYIECASTTFSGSYSEAESKVEKAGFTLSPAYSECTSEILGNVTTATVTVNGCTYQLKDEEAASGTPKEEGWEYTGSLTVKCPEGKKIEAHVFETTKKDEEATSLCTYTIAEQGPLKPIDYKVDEAGKKITVNSTLSSVAVSRTTGTVTNCGAASQTGSYTGNASVEGSGPTRTGLTSSLDAEEIVPTGKGRITASQYPATFKGAQVGINEMILPGGRKFRCSTANYAGTLTEAEAKAESWAMSITPEYKECTAEILGNVDIATVTMNGCSYRVTSEEWATTTKLVGSMDVKCPEGKKIEAHVFETTKKHEEGVSLCTYTIAEQGPLKSFNYTLSGTEGHPHTYLTSSGSTSIAASRVSGTLTNCGAASQTGEVHSEVKFEAVNGFGEMEEMSVDAE